MARRYLLRLRVVLAAALLAAACTSAWRSPDLGGLYDRAAQSHDPSRNPVIVIPGLTGSTLQDDATGQIVWGVFSGDYARPSRPGGARASALPMAEGVPLARLTDQVHATGVLDRVELRLLGVPLHIRAYTQILAALGAGGYRDESLGLSGGWTTERGTSPASSFPTTGGARTPATAPPAYSRHAPAPPSAAGTPARTADDYSASWTPTRR